MGQKINPLGFRIGITEPHRATWFARGRAYGELVAQDYFIRDFLKKRFRQAAIEKIHIERKADRTTVTLHSGRPGVVIGKRGSEIDLVTSELEKLSKGKVKVNIVEVRKPQICGQLVAENVADQLERRGSFRRAIKRAVEDAMREGAKGCMVKISGRLGGNEIARSEDERMGSVPLNQLQAHIDYGYATARTTYGIIGVRVWVHHGRYEEQEN